MDVIFLDIDGVFNTNSNNEKIYVRNENFHINFDIKLLNMFVKLCKFCMENDVKLVMTTSHSINKTIEEWERFIRETFRLFSFNNVIIGLDKYQQKDRGLFIQDFVTDYNIVNYLVIDDVIKDIKPFIPMENIIEINKKYGINNDKLNFIKLYFKYITK
jgi:hypothetical protein